MKKFIFALAVLSFIIFAGCSLFGRRLESPRIFVSYIEVQKVEFFESSFTVELRVLNPNDIPLKMKGLNCGIEINDRHFATGVAKINTLIPAYGTIIVPVEVYSSAISLFRSIFAMKGKQALTYKIEGHIHVDAGFLNPSKIPFKSQGEIGIIIGNAKKKTLWTFLISDKHNPLTFSVVPKFGADFQHLFI